MMNLNWLPVMALLVQAPAAPQIRPEERASIQGFVVKMGTGEPVSKAVVTLSRFSGGPGQTFSATTASGGQFAFQNLEPGQYRLSATRNGYVRSEYGARSPNRAGLPITLAPGQRANQLILQLMPAGTITGRVFDRDGEALANVNVQALKYTYQEGQRVLNPVQQARTNDLGEYRLFWLQPGSYYVSATPPEGQRGGVLFASPVAGPGIGGEVPAAGNRGPRGGARGGQTTSPPTPASVESQDQGYVSVYYPGTTDAQSAAPINLTPGSSFSGVDLTVMVVRTVRIRGQVINGVTGQPARNANILLAPRRRGAVRESREFRNTNINEQGIFEIRGVVPGSYDLIGIINERNNRLSARMPLEVGNADVQNVALILNPGFTLTGRVAVEGQPPGAASAELARTRVMLRPDAGVQQVGGAPPAASVQADGTFTVQQVGRDDYRLSVTGMPQNGYVRAARLGAIDVLNDGIRLDRTPNTPLEILISTKTGTAGGLVQNERQEPATNVLVVFVPDAARRHRLDLYRTASTDAQGRFRLQGLPPGEYKVFAFEDVETGAWQDPEFIRQFDDRGKTLRIDESSQSTIELRIIPSQM